MCYDLLRFSPCSEICSGVCCLLLQDSRRCRPPLSSPPLFSRVRTARIVRIESDRTTLSNSTQLKQLNSSFDKRRHSLLTFLVATKRRAHFFGSRRYTSGFFLNSFFKTTTRKCSRRTEYHEALCNSFFGKITRNTSGVLYSNSLHHSSKLLLLPQHRILRSAPLFFQKNNNNDERLYHIHSVTFIAHHILLQKKDFRKSNHFPNKNIPSKTYPKYHHRYKNRTSKIANIPYRSPDYIIREVRFRKFVSNKQLSIIYHSGSEIFENATLPFPKISNSTTLHSPRNNRPSANFPATRSQPADQVKRHTQIRPIFCIRVTAIRIARALNPLATIGA